MMEASRYRGVGCKRLLGGTCVTLRFRVITRAVPIDEHHRLIADLEKAFQSRNGDLNNIRWAIPYESLRDDPRFKELLKRLNLPE